MDGCVRAAEAGRFRAVRYDGFWAPMDTLKERMALEEMYRSGNRPWALWEKESQAGPATAGRWSSPRPGSVKSLLSPTAR